MAVTRGASNRSFIPSLLVAGGCFFLTGLAALVYEICCIRQASLAFGSVTWAVSAVLAVFFAGLAGGSFIVGWYSPRVSRPLRLYAWLELGVGLAATLSPAMFLLTDTLYGAVYPHVRHSVPLLALTRLSAVTVVILPATLLMGGSLPLFCRQYVQHDRRIARGVGLLYGLNTLGAAVGSATCGFWLIPHVGVEASMYLAGLVNILVSLIAFRLAGRRVLEIDRSEIKADAAPRSVEPVTLQRSGSPIVGWLFFGVGFVALANEVLWTRYLSLWMPNTVYTYTLTLTVVLVGIVLGSLLAALVSDRFPWRAGLFGAAQVAGGLTIMLVMQLRPAWWGNWLTPVSISQQLSVIMLVMLVPAILSGLSFPLAVRLAVRHASETGSAVGKMAAINMFGGIAGSLLVGFAALPLLGLQFTLFFITGVSLSLGITAWWTLETRPSRRLRASWVLVSLLLWGAIPYFCQTRLPRDFLASEGTLVDYREGIGANVSVIRKADVLYLEINRMWQGQDRKNHQVMAAHIPALLHPDPKSVLVIGLGTGQTARSFLVHDIDRLDCVEIEDGLIDLVAQHFDGAWMEDPRVHLMVEDGRNYVTHTSEQYDLISIEVGQIYRPRVASFYTADFYQRLWSRLRPAGLVCQFVPIEFFGPTEFRTLIATFLHVFPNSVLWYNTSELLLIGSKEQSIRVDLRRLTSLMAGNPQLKQELDYAYWGGPAFYLSRPEAFLAGFLCGPEQLRKLGEGGDIYRDERPYLEYITLLSPTGATDIVALLRRYLSPLPTVVETSDHKLLVSSRTIRQMNLQEIVARLAVSRGQALEAEGRWQDALPEYYQALEAMPNHPKANFSLAVLLQSQGQSENAISCYRRALTVKPDDVRTLYNLAVLLQMDGRLAEAAECYRRTLESDPNHVKAHVNLAGILVVQQRLDEAILHYRSAVKMDPRATDVHLKLGWALAMAGRLEQANDCFEEALRWQPDLARAHLGIGNVLLSSGRPDQAAEAYERAITCDPRLVEAYVSLGFLMQNSGRWNRALQHFRTAVKLAPNDPVSLSRAAWIMATRTNVTQRDPAQAIAWAEQAWRVTGNQDPQVADVLAAAYAAAGEFERATAMAEQALQLATARKMDEFADQVRQRLALYQQGKPFDQ